MVLKVDTDKTKQTGTVVGALSPTQTAALSGLYDVNPKPGAGFPEADTLRNRIVTHTDEYKAKLRQLRDSCEALNQKLNDIANGYVDLENENTKRADRQSYVEALNDVSTRLGGPGASPPGGNPSPGGNPPPGGGPGSGEQKK
jgi:hypothetical protein